MVLAGGHSCCAFEFGDVFLISHLLLAQSSVGLGTHYTATLENVAAHCRAVVTAVNQKGAGPASVHCAQSDFTVSQPLSSCSFLTLHIFRYESLDRTKNGQKDLI